MNRKFNRGVIFLNKKGVIIIGIIILILIISAILYYNFSKNGNTNINKTDEQIVQDILNISSYKAKVEIEVTSNKNSNKYIVKQELKRGNISKQEVIEPENLAGIITEHDGKNLKIVNNRLNLTTTYENYEYIVNNRLWLDSFISEYKNSSSTNTIVEENQIILEIQSKDDIYNTYKRLYIDKKTGKPTKMTVADINKKMTAYILYSEIEIS